jgi:hypothetical protein
MDHPDWEPDFQRIVRHSRVFASSRFFGAAPMKKALILRCLLILGASGAIAQTPDSAVWRSSGPGVAGVRAPVPQFIQQELGRHWDRDRMAPGSRMSYDADDDGDHGRSSGRAWTRPWGSAGPQTEGHAGMHPPMGGMMGLGGARFHMRRGDAAIDVRCPSDVRFNECVEAIGRIIDRLGAMGAGSVGAPD